MIHAKHSQRSGPRPTSRTAGTSDAPREPLIVATEDTVAAVKSVLANWETGDLAGAVNRLRLWADSLRRAIRRATSGASKQPRGNRVDRFLRGNGFIVLGMNRGDASPGSPFEAWAHRGLLDFEAASPVVFGLGSNPIEALNALAHQLAGRARPNIHRPAMADSRYLHQQQIIPADRLAAVKATVVGVGAIGRQVAIQLAAIGVPWLQLTDHDVVEEVNLAPQGYLEADLGKPKVEATAEMCSRLNSQVELHPEQARFRRSMEIGNVIFACVDKIDTRRLIWEAVKDKADFWADGRMSAEVLRVLTACDAAGRRHYPTTLFAQAEAFVGACTARSTIFCANIAAGLMVSQFAKWLRGLPVDSDFSLNLLAMELAIDGAQTQTIT